jgi:hypothetical protein
MLFSLTVHFKLLRGMYTFRSTGHPHQPTLSSDYSKVRHSNPCWSGQSWVPFLKTGYQFTRFRRLHSHKTWFNGEYEQQWKLPAAKSKTWHESPLRTIIIEKNSLVLSLLFSSVLFHTGLWFHPWFQQNWGTIAQVWGTLGLRGPRKWKMVGFAIKDEVEWGISENPIIWVLPNCCLTTFNTIFHLQDHPPMKERTQTLYSSEWYASLWPPNSHQSPWSYTTATN